MYLDHENIVAVYIKPHIFKTVELAFFLSNYVLFNISIYECGIWTQFQLIQTL